MQDLISRQAAIDTLENTKTAQNAIKGVTWKCVPYYPEPPKEVPTDV